MHEKLKISCWLDGDTSIDFERMALVLKASQYAKSRPRQQSILVAASILVLDAAMKKFTEASGKRYPTIVELLEFAGVSKQDIVRLLKIPDEKSMEPIAAAISSGLKKVT